jgi:uncharacterized protein GlcG (DUF336 family)
MEVRMLTLSKSRQIVDAAIRRAQDLGINISVAVCDGNGRLIAFHQMDGSVGWEVDRSAMGKAVAAAITGLPSDRLFQYMQTSESRHALHNHVITPRGQRGGLPVVREGRVQGGCGVSGAATTEQDEECARAGIAVLDPIKAESPRASYARDPRFLLPWRARPEGFQGL